MSATVDAQLFVDYFRVPPASLSQNPDAAEIKCSLIEVAGTTHAVEVFRLDIR